MKIIDKVNLIESNATCLKEAIIDEENGIIKHVAITAKESKNKRTYSEKALENIALFADGMKAYFDHPTNADIKERNNVRSIKDMFGTYSNIITEKGKIYGDLKVLEPYKPLIFGLASQMPEAVGNSIRVSGKLTKGRHGENDIVESVDTLFGIELVTEPATTQGFFESLPKGDNVEIKDITVDFIKENCPDIIEQIMTEKEGDDVHMEDVKKLKEENGILKAKLAKEEEEKKLAEMVAKKKEIIDKLIDESKISSEFITEVFKSDLFLIEGRDKFEEEVKKRIADRKHILEKITSKVKGNTEKKLNFGERKDKMENIKEETNAFISEYKRT